MNSIVLFLITYYNIIVSSIIKYFSVKPKPVDLELSHSVGYIDIPAVFVYYQGDKYNVTKFLIEHPGGATNLRKYHEKDIESIMKTIGHSEIAYNRLSEMKV